MKEFFWLALISLAGCSSEWTIDLSNVNSSNNPVLQPSIQYPDWTNVSLGIDMKQTFINEELFNIVRIDPNQADIIVRIDETTPKTVSDWQEIGDYTLVINGSYFDEHYALVTRTVVDGITAGPLLSGQTGIFTQQNDQWVISADTSALSNTGVTGVQSYPILVFDGVAQVESNSTDTAQRTVVAVDAAGLVYFIVCEYGVLTLTELSSALTILTDPTLVHALNLDGGTSTGLAIHSDTVSYLDDSLIVPSIVAVP